MLSTTIEPIVKERFYINVPYADKDDAKQHGARYDMDLKQWYTMQNNKDHKYLMEKYNKPIIKASRIYLKVPYDSKDDAKEHGARYDMDNKAWFTWSNNDYKNYLLENYGEFL